MAARCTSAAKQTGKRCRKAPIHGGTVCEIHGGKAPQVKRAAARRVAEVEALEAVETMLHDKDAPPVTDAFAALLRLAGRMEAAVDHVGQRINVLQNLRTLDDKGTEQIHAEVGVWERLTAQLLRALDVIARNDIAARALQLDEARLALVVTALDMALADADLSDIAQWNVRRRFAKALEAS